MNIYNIIADVDTRNRLNHISKEKLTDINENYTQYKFDFSCCNNDVVYTKTECRCIYKKSDGSIYTKITKARPIINETTKVSIGYKNSYGHELIDMYQQYKFIF